MMIHFVTRNKNSRWVRITGKEQKECTSTLQTPIFSKVFQMGIFYFFSTQCTKRNKSVCTNVQCTLLERRSKVEINATFLPSFFAKVGHCSGQDLF